MPQVPVLNSQVSPQAAPDFQQRPLQSTGTQELGQGVSNVGSVLYEVHKQEQQKADRAAYQEATIGLSNAENSILYDPQKGAFTKQGKDAFGLPAQVLPQLDQSIASISQGLKSPKAREAFNIAAGERRAQVSRELNHYEFGQRENYYDALDEATISNSVTRAGRMADQPDALTSEIQTQQATVAGMAKRKGWDATVTQQKQQQAVGKTHQAVIEDLMVQNRFADAQKYLGMHSLEMPDLEAEQLKRAIQSGQAAALAAQKRAQEEVQKGTQNDFLARMQKGSLTPQDILHSNLDPFGSGSKDEFLNMLRTQSERPAKTDPALFNELFARAHVPDGTPGKLTNENQLNPYVIAGRINMEDLTKLRNEIQGQNTSDGQSEAMLKKGMFDVAKAALTRSNPFLGIQDPEGEANLQRFTTWFLNEYTQQRAAGKSPNQLLNPDSADYLGKRLQSFVRSPQEILRDQLGAATGAPATNAPARKDGESPDDYLKRVGKK